jgi:branched-chain amino acid transport system ATP-binding protein
MATPFIAIQRGALLAEGPYAEVSKNPQVIEAYMGTTQTELAGSH